MHPGAEVMSMFLYSIRVRIRSNVCLAFGFLCIVGVSNASGAIAWKECLRQRGEFYASDEAVRIADNVLLYQRSSGGWPKNTDMAVILGDRERSRLRSEKNNRDSTIDNGATYTQMRYLARVYCACGKDRFRDAFSTGLDYLLEAQYENGGWPQFYPLRSQGSYYNHITFNDNAMIGVMSLLRDIVEQKADYRFVDEDRRNRSLRAVQRGIECILKTQVVVDGIKTAWCAQCDEKTLKPAEARSYEKISISGSESVGIVRFLMGIEDPDSRVIDAVQSAVAWFNRVRIEGIAIVSKRDNSEKGYDKVVVNDASAPAVWARFYQIGTNRPIFCGRDGVIKYRLSEIEQERRTGYSWYGTSPNDLLTRDYPAWQKKWAPNKNVLAD